MLMLRRYDLYYIYVIGYYNIVKFLVILVYGDLVYFVIDLVVSFDVL